MTRCSQTKTALYFFAIVLGAWSADADEVILRPQVNAKGSLVLLGDVAEVKAANAERAETLKRIELFPAPAKSRSKLMHVRELVELLVLNGVDISDIEFKGTQTTRVFARRKASPVVKAQLQTPAVQPTEMIVVARRALNRGDVLREADVTLEPADPKMRIMNFATDKRQVVGMQAMYSVREGQPVVVSQLRKPLLVKRGELIRVRARAAGVQVITTAKATQDGALGDVILVQSLENREQYAARVTNLQQVEVYATGVVASERTAANRQQPLSITEKK